MFQRSHVPLCQQLSDIDPDTVRITLYKFSIRPLPTKLDKINTRNLPIPKLKDFKFKF